MSLANYLSETREELKQVRWPTRRQTFVFMALVIVISVVVAAYLGAFDFLFSSGLKAVLF
ncbi:MAG: preprotein translocase subunit SecE [Patescibacteria group bacterium]|nr:preprotein translocase subunit SecE [Patescibacteria group bacterium]MDE1945794.1 preprotein translocase subunit SecE [Patescibacteria group bacterium]